MKKDYSRKISLTNQKEGLERREELLGEITEKGTYLPKPIDYSDIDTSTLDFIENEISLVVEGRKVPVFFMSIQKWIEFTKTWGNSNEYKDVEMPFITIVRDPDIQPGTNQDGLFDVPGFPTFFYHKVPTFDNGREGFDLYKIPQPTSSDLTYHVRFFTNRMQELNTIQNKIQRTFKSRQFYVNVLGHPMPIVLDGVNDESKIDDVEARRYYALDFEMVVNGYILNEDDFEVTPLKDRALLIMEGDSNVPLKPGVKKKISNGSVNYEITYKYSSSETAIIEVMEPTDIIEVSNEFKVDSVSFKVNGVEIVNPLPFSVNRGDKLEISITRAENITAFLILSGNLS